VEAADGGEEKKAAKAEVAAAADALAEEFATKVEAKAEGEETA
jgi:hypothetical protein